MKIPRTRRHRLPLEVSMTPLVDLFLNILIFFLVTTTFSADSVFFVDLPETKAAEEVGEQSQIVVSVGAKGEVAYNNFRTTLSSLRDRLAEIPKERRGVVPVVVRADRSAVHGDVVKVIDLIRETGLTNIGIVTQQGTP